MSRQIAVTSPTGNQGDTPSFIANYQAAPSSHISCNAPRIHGARINLKSLPPPPNPHLPPSAVALANKGARIVCADLTIPFRHRCCAKGLLLYLRRNQFLQFCSRSIRRGVDGGRSTVIRVTTQNLVDAAKRNCIGLHSLLH